MNTEQLKSLFIEKYGKEGEQPLIYFSPGRVNLIGEHTDYNGGYVFPCALSYGTYVVARKTNDNKIKFASTNIPFEATVSVSETHKKQGEEWINYPLGVIEQFKKRGATVGGMELLFSGNIPNGAGLSSSASVELVTSVTINDLFSCNVSMLDMVKLSQKAENEFVGVNCGIMDQFAVGMGKENHAIYLDCNTLDYELVPVVLDGYKIIVANTNKRRGLADSKYNERRSECDTAVELINKVKAIKTLGELDNAGFESVKSTIASEVVQRRAKHAVSENQRTKEAVTALKKGDLLAFGQLMNESHDSLRDDYEVTGVELDTLVEEARKINGVIGSRMTGAGFGGCTVSIVKTEAVDAFCKEVAVNYEKRTGLKADFYIADIGDGAKRLN